MTPAEFRSTIVEPALNAIGLWSESAAVLLVATAIQETGLQNIAQIGGGPARGYFQIESATYHDQYDNWLDYRPDLAAKVNALCVPDLPSFAEIMAHPQYACAIARIKYLRVPEPLPHADDMPGMAAFWRRYYNAGGKGTEEEFIANWQRRQMQAA